MGKIDFPVSFFGRKPWEKNIFGCFCFSYLSALRNFDPGGNHQAKSHCRDGQLRLLPELGSRIVGTASVGKILESAERIGDWFKVSLPPGKMELKSPAISTLKRWKSKLRSPGSAATSPIPEDRAESRPGTRAGIAAGTQSPFCHKDQRRFRSSFRRRR